MLWVLNVKNLPKSNLYILKRTFLKYSYVPPIEYDELDKYKTAYTPATKWTLTKRSYRWLLRSIRKKFFKNFIPGTFIRKRGPRRYYRQWLRTRLRKKKLEANIRYRKVWTTRPAKLKKLKLKKTITTQRYWPHIDSKYTQLYLPPLTVIADIRHESRYMASQQSLDINFKYPHTITNRKVETRKARLGKVLKKYKNKKLFNTKNLNFFKKPVGSAINKPILQVSPSARWRMPLNKKTNIPRLPSTVKPYVHFKAQGTKPTPLHNSALDRKRWYIRKKEIDVLADFEEEIFVPPRNFPKKMKHFIQNFKYFQKKKYFPKPTEGYKIMGLFFFKKKKKIPRSSLTLIPRRYKAMHKLQRQLMKVEETGWRYFYKLFKYKLMCRNYKHTPNFPLKMLIRHRYLEWVIDWNHADLSDVVYGFFGDTWQAYKSLWYKKMFFYDYSKQILNKKQKVNLPSASPKINKNIFLKKKTFKKLLSSFSKAGLLGKRINLVDFLFKKKKIDKLRDLALNEISRNIKKESNFKALRKKWKKYRKSRAVRIKKVRFKSKLVERFYRKTYNSLVPNHPASRIPELLDQWASGLLLSSQNSWGFLQKKKLIVRFLKKKITFSTDYVDEINLKKTPKVPKPRVYGNCSRNANYLWWFITKKNFKKKSYLFYKKDKKPNKFQEILAKRKLKIKSEFFLKEWKHVQFRNKIKHTDINHLKQSIFKYLPNRKKILTKKIGSVKKKIPQFKEIVYTDAIESALSNTHHPAKRLTLKTPRGKYLNWKQNKIFNEPGTKTLNMGSDIYKTLGNLFQKVTSRRSILLKLLIIWKKNKVRLKPLNKIITRKLRSQVVINPFKVILRGRSLSSYKKTALFESRKSTKKTYRKWTATLPNQLTGFIGRSAPKFSKIANKVSTHVLRWNNKIMGLRVYNTKYQKYTQIHCLLIRTIPLFRVKNAKQLWMWYKYITQKKAVIFRYLLTR